MRHRPSILALSVLFTACVGAISDEDGLPKPSDPDPPGATARQLFDKNIYPVLSDKCGSSACHAATNAANGAFVAATAAGGYDLAVNEPKLVSVFTPQAPILQKIANGHYATYSPAEVVAITKWLGQEVMERGNQRDLLREFSGCMNFGDFNTAKMPETWANEEADNAGRCVTCHSAGGNAFYANDIAGDFFDALTLDRGRLSKYFTVDAAKTKVIINQEEFESAGMPRAPHANHAPWDYENGKNMVALRSFYDLTMQRMAAGGCPAPRF